jgi:hypothetical protein
LLACAVVSAFAFRRGPLAADPDAAPIIAHWKRPKFVVRLF